MASTAHHGHVMDSSEWFQSWGILAAACARVGWEWGILVTEGWRLVGGGVGAGPRGGLGHHSILLHTSTVWDGGGGEDGYRDRQPGGEREVPDDNSTAGAAFSCPALQGTEGNQARASEAKNG